MMFDGPRDRAERPQNPLAGSGTHPTRSSVRKRRVESSKCLGSLSTSGRWVSADVSRSSPRDQPVQASLLIAARTAPGRAQMVCLPMSTRRWPGQSDRILRRLGVQVEAELTKRWALQACASASTPRIGLQRDSLRRNSSRGKARARTYFRPKFKGLPFPVTFKEMIQA